jgi:hypothetical protein
MFIQGSIKTGLNGIDSYHYIPPFYLFISCPPDFSSSFLLGGGGGARSGRCLENLTTQGKHLGVSPW